MNVLKDLITGQDDSVALVKVLAVLIVVALLAKNVWLSVHAGQDVPLDWHQITLVLGSLGAALGHKALDRAAPTPSVPTP